MSRYTRGLLAVILAVVLVLPAAAFAMLPEANARSSTGMDGPTVTVDPDTTDNWTYWAAGSDGSGKITTQNVGRIWTDKTVEAGDKSDFVTTLSAISSTSNTITTVPKPLDIVMVLDASGSMDDPMSSSDRTKRIDALKIAANSFIEKIVEENAKISDESKQHQVAIVKFAGNETGKVGNDTYREGGYTYNYSQTMMRLTPCSGDDVNNLKSMVSSIRPAGATRADYGMELAEGIASDREDAKKVVLFFTDGSPTSSSGFESSVANSAINKANSLKKDGAVIYTIGIFSGANPSADPTASGTIKENKFMHAVSSNYPTAASSISFWGEWTINFGARAENANYYKSAKNAQELEDIFKDISESITEVVGYPTEVHDGYGEHKSGYITFTDELGDFMQVDDFTEVEYNGTTFKDPEKSTKGNVDNYTFAGEAANLVITVQRAAEGNPQRGDIVEVKIPASLIPLRKFDVDETKGTLKVSDVEPIRVKYASSVKDIARENLFTPDEALRKYIEKNTTGEQGSKSVAFYANKWSGDKDLGDTIANFKPATTNRYYFFQKQTPIYMDPACTQPAKEKLASDRHYYYQDEFEVADGGGKLDHGTTVIEFTGRHAAQFAGAVVKDESSGNLSFSEGTARLAFIDELHTDKKSNATETASDVLNPRWNDTSSKESATHVDVHLGNNGKISFDVTPATVDTKAKFGLTKVLEGRDWTDTDEFKFELSATSGNDTPMPASATAAVRKRNTTIDFGKITYNKPGEYTYEVREIAGELGGITYSDYVAKITVKVTVDTAGKLTAKVTKAEDKVFTNTYNAKTETPLTLEATKTLSGRPMADDEFKFALSYAGHDEALLETTNKGGKVEFGPLTYTTESLAKLVKEDKASFDVSSGKPTWTIHYVAAEQTGELPAGVSATVSAIDAYVTVVDNGDGTLTATAAYGDAGNEFVNAYNLTPKVSSVTDQITATKVLTGREPGLAAGEFRFELVEGDKVVVTGTNNADGKIVMDPVTYEAAGEHTYKLRETKAGAIENGITYSTAEYTIVTKVTDNGDGTLGVEHKLQNAKEAIFENAYNVTPKSFSVTDQITATKVLTGRALEKGEFSFELVEGEGKDAKVVATGKNAADGNITMSPIEYKEAGKHTYTLREVKGSAGGVTYSDAKYTIETTITDNGDGTLKAEHVLNGDKPVTFENTYSVTPTDAELDFGLSKVINGRDWTDADKFSFTITSPEGAPLPDPATVTVSKKSADDDGIAAIEFGRIRYTAAGTYKYEIRENAGNAAGMTYDGNVATAEVTVTENGEGKLIANVTKTEDGRFTNTYSTELNYTAAGGLKLSKTLSGRPMTEGQFTFTVKPADEASAKALDLLPGVNEFKSPATTEGAVGLIDILAGHEVKFTQADAGKTFTYTVAEKNDRQPGYTYDDAERTVTIAIADDGAGTLTATTTVSGGPEGTHAMVHKSGENKVESALVPFENSYSATTNKPVQVVAAKKLTGRLMADGEFYFGIAYAGETEAIQGTPATNLGGQVSFGTLHYTTKMLADLVSAGRAHRTDMDAKPAWTINYTAFEYTNALADKGISAETSSFDFKVIVVDNGDGTLTATADYGGAEPVFENVYGAEAVDDELTGTKKLQAAEGLTPADIAGKFTFTVTADEAGAPMPERTTATNDAAGNVDFGKIHFTLDDLNRALGVKTDVSGDASSDAEANAGEAEVDADENDAEVNGDESDASDESKPAAPIAPRSHTFTYTVTESGSAPGVTNDANATRKVSYTVTDDGAGHLSVKREGADGAAFTFTNTYSVAPTDSVVTDQVKTVKRLTGRDLAAGEFTFELLEDGVVVASGTNDASGTVTLNPIRYEAPGTHTYMLREACPNALGLYKGVTYDGTTYTVVTTVFDNGDGTLTATHKLEGTTESAGFTNKYHAMPTQVSIGAIKVLEGRELKKDEFSFKLVGEDIESTVTNDADGKISFDKFEYDEPGTYVYTISEVKGDEAGMTYDKSVFTATVNVVDDSEGNLKASVAFTKGDESVEGIVFNNTYKKPETPVPTPDPGTPKTVTNIVKTVKGFLPTTGDQQAAALLMAFVVAMSGVGALIWGIRKR